MPRIILPMGTLSIARRLLVLATLSTAAATPALGQTPVTGPAGTITPPQNILEHQSPRPRLSPGEILVDDMILDADRLGRFESAVQPGAHYESFTARPWEFGVVPVSFDEGVTDMQKQTFFNACAFWAPSGVLCVERTDHPAWVHVTRLDDGCYSKVGMGTAGPQTLNLQSPGCWGTGTVAHEIGHTIGLIHEHQRADRGTYVTINYENIEDGKSGNFTIYVTARMWTTYDFNSLMHYSKTSFAKSSGLETITPKPEYASQATNMGQRSAVTPSDTACVAGLYNLPPRTFRTYALSPRVFTINRNEAVATMAAINSYYQAPEGLARPNGLSLNGKPDFLGLAAWFFDVYANTRFAGYQEIEARYNVAAHLTQSEEWRTKHPGQLPAVPFVVGNSLPFDRSELLAVMERLDRFYSAPEGLQRPNGLSLGGQPDFLGIAAWVVDVYWGRRMAGESPDKAWERVVFEIQQTDEWRSKHR